MICNVFADYKEDNWESMNVYTDILVQSLQQEHYKKFSVHIIRGARQISTCISKNNKLLRLFFRYGVNPALAPMFQADMNHIVDQSNAHLLRFINPKKTVITCHDTIVPYWDEQSDSSASWKNSVRRGVQHWRMDSIRTAGAVIAVSEATKGEIVKNLHVLPDKVFVIYEAVEDNFKPQQSRVCQSMKEKYRLPDRFMLHVGTNAPYKNIPFLLKIFKELLHRDNSFYLVKVGSIWTDEQRTLITSLGLNDRVIYLGFLPRKILPSIYSLASFLYYPSIIEGFGLPVLEAISCGCPVVTSDASALVEVSGDAAIHVKNDASKHVVEQILSVMIDDKFRQMYKQKGLSRAKFFSPAKMARQTYRVYQQLLSL